ncbi:MAG: hypothetical protein LBC75_06555 [Fibromonadaceae bacterium]|jgi:uncharacterized protein (TIGR02145 family)|nr:hypothetical protein [Fibromonadaceae bacterium]
MKINLFLSLAAIFAIILTFFACSSDSPTEQQGGESSGDAAKLCGDVEYNANIYRCEYGELIGKCNGADFRPAYQVCNNGVIEDKKTLSSSSVSSSSIVQSSSSVSNSSSGCALNDLGKGYDVIGSPYINWTDVKNIPVLDQGKMCEDGILDLDKPGGAQQYAWFSGSTVEELYSKRNESMKIGANLGVEIKIPLVFSAGVDVKFAKNTSNGSQQSSSKKYFYSQIRSYRYTGEHQIKSGSESVQNLSKYLTNDFISDLKSTKSPGQILDLYGSHVFIHYFKGGSLEANYTYTGSNSASRFTSAEQMELAAKGSFKKQLNFTAGIEYGTSASDEQEIKELEEHLSFYYVAYGGKSLKASEDMSELVKEYGGWVETIEQNARTTGIKDFAQSFIPIWDLAQQVEGVSSSRISDLKSEFKKRAEAQGAKFPEADCTPEDNNDTHYCSNGFLKEYGKVTDGGGKTYKTVVIGTQTWIAENLNYNVTGSKCGNGSTSTFGDANTSTCNTYGRLYDWSTAMALSNSCNSTGCLSQIKSKHQGICPVGYHIPTKADWDNLIIYVGDEEVAGRYLKAVFGWANCGSSSSYKYKCEDKYGFSALPGGAGIPEPDGRFLGIGEEGYWWTASENNADYAYPRNISYENNSVNQKNFKKIGLLSVRCLKD